MRTASHHWKVAKADEMTTADGITPEITKVRDTEATHVSTSHRVTMAMDAKTREGEMILDPAAEVAMIDMATQTGAIVPL